MVYSLAAVRKYTAKQKRRGMCSRCKTRKANKPYKSCDLCRERGNNQHKKWCDDHFRNDTCHARTR